MPVPTTPPRGPPPYTSCISPPDPDPDRVAALVAASWSPHRIAVRGRGIVICYADVMHGSRLQYATALKRLGVDGTARNWRTPRALVDLTVSA